MISSTVLALGCDWITVTAQDPNKAFRLATRAGVLLRRELQDGNRKRVFRMAGYEGFKAGQVQLGSRDDGAIVRLSGAMAHQHWKHVLEVSDNCSRLDVQATIRWNRLAHKMIAKHYREALTLTRRRIKNQTATILKASDGSSTLYLGQRASERFGRVYNKGLQSRDPAWYDSVRYEVELKGDTARAAAQSALLHSNPISYLVGQLSSFLKDHLGLQPKVLGGCSSLEVLRSASDEARSLRWLEESVRPTVTRFVADGKLDQVLAALGLDDLVLPRTIAQVTTGEEASDYEC